MDFVPASRRITASQLYNKVYRRSRVKLFTLPWRQKRKGADVLLLKRELPIDPAVEHRDAEVATQLLAEDRIPLQAYMYYPIGLIPDPTESFCVGVFLNNRLAGWGWFHLGPRRDVVSAHNLELSTLERIVWLGPAYVRPRYRGRGLQKVLIQRRLLEAQRLYHMKDLVAITLVGADNIPSIASLKRLGFVLIGQPQSRGGR